MKKFRVHLSSGQFITVHAENIRLIRDGDSGKYSGYRFEGLRYPNKFLSFSIPDIIAVEET